MLGLDSLRRKKITERLYSTYQGSWRPLFARYSGGVNVFDRDWDVLIILDGCRVDTLQSVAHEYDFLETVGSERSVGSQSKEWLAKTFTPAHARAIGETAYVTGNVFTRQVFGDDSPNRSPFNPANWNTVHGDDFLLLDEVWRDGWDDDLGTVPPRPITDRGIEAWITDRPERMILHYMQPHQPFIAGDEVIGSISGEDVWQQLRRGTLDRETVLAAYRDNLRLVLDEVELLLESIDADTVVITADHGNAMGEWFIYGHPIGFLHSSVKDVPWVETIARDTGAYDPPVEAEKREVTTSVQDRLEQLGYM